MVKGRSRVYSICLAAADAKLPFPLAGRRQAYTVYPTSGC